MITGIDAKTLTTSLELLDNILSKEAHPPLTLVICGGGAMVALGFKERRTNDIDVIDPLLDPVVLEAAKKTAKTLNLQENWLNNGPRDLLNHLPNDWFIKTESVFLGKTIRVVRLGRRDLISSKLWAEADRQADFFDLVSLHPTEQELVEAVAFVEKLDANPNWPSEIMRIAKKIRIKLGYLVLGD